MPSSKDRASFLQLASCGEHQKLSNDVRCGKQCCQWEVDVSDRDEAWGDRSISSWCRLGRWEDDQLTTCHLESQVRRCQP